MLVTVIICGVHPATAQTTRLEGGVFLGAIDFRESLYEKPFAVGARVGYRFNSILGAEATLTRCPEDASNNYGQTVFVVGPKAGVRYRAIHAYGRAQGGVLHLSGGAFTAWNGVRTEPAVDIGGGVELEMNPRIAFRIDTGVLVVPFGEKPVRGPLPPYSGTLGITRSRGGSVGLQFRF